MAASAVPDPSPSAASKLVKSVQRCSRDLRQSSSTTNANARSNATQPHIAGPLQQQQQLPPLVRRSPSKPSPPSVSTAPCERKLLLFPEEPRGERTKLLHHRALLELPRETEPETRPPNSDLSERTAGPLAGVTAAGEPSRSGDIVAHRSASIVNKREQK